jgi:hypothetical protein
MEEIKLPYGFKSGQFGCAPLTPAEIADLPTKCQPLTGFGDQHAYVIALIGVRYWSLNGVIAAIKRLMRDGEMSISDSMIPTYNPCSVMKRIYQDGACGMDHTMLSAPDEHIGLYAELGIAVPFKNGEGEFRLRVGPNANQATLGAFEALRDQAREWGKGVAMVWEEEKKPYSFSDPTWRLMNSIVPVKIRVVSKAGWWGYIGEAAAVLEGADTLEEAQHAMTLELAAYHARQAEAVRAFAATIAPEPREDQAEEKES